MSLSLFFPFSPQWVLPAFVGPRSWQFVVSFPGPAPEGFAAWVRSSPAVEVERVYPCVAWRVFRPGVAVRLTVRDAAVAQAIRSAAPKGGGGSLHPGNAMLG